MANDKEQILRNIKRLREMRETAADEAAQARLLAETKRLATPKTPRTRTPRPRRRWNFGSSDASQVITPGFWIFLSIVLYLTDWLTNFYGISFTNVINSFLSLGEGITKFVLFVTFLAIIFYLLTREGLSRTEDFKSSFFLAFVFGAIFVFGWYVLGIYHILFIIALYFGAARPVAKAKGIPSSHVNYTFAFLLTLDFFIYGFIIWMFRYVGLTLDPVLTNRFLLPIWFLYVAFGLTSGIKKSSFTKWAIFIAFVLISFVIIGDIAQVNQMHYEKSIAGEEFTEAVKEYGSAWQRFLDLIYRLLDPFICLPKFTDNEAYQGCIKDRLIARHPELNESMIKGTTDKHIKGITKVELVKSTKFPSVIQKELTPKLPVGYILDINAPELIKIKLSCSFKNPKNIEYAGTIGPKKTVKRLAEEGIQGTKKEQIVCQPETNYAAGHNKVIFKAEILNIETKSWLTRLFAGPDVENKRINELKRLHELSDSASESGEEFAVFSFNFGIPTAAGESVSAILGDSDIQVIEGGIENRGEGRITLINNLKINLIPEIDLPKEPAAIDACTQLFDYSGDQLILKREKEIANLKLEKGKTLPLLKGCYFNINDKLRFPKNEGFEYYKREFSAEMVYSYEIQKEERFEVRSDNILAKT